MRAAGLPIALFCVLVGPAGPAGADPPATPAPKPESAPQHVTAPSLPGQPNREGTVRPEGGMPMDSEGYAVTKRYDPGAASGKPAPQSGSKAGGNASGAAASGPATVPDIPVGPAPAGKGIATGANYFNLRGSVVALVPGRSVTIRTEKTGVENTYTLAPGAAVGKGVAPGQLVRVRVLLQEKGKVADKVDLVPPPSPSPAKKEGHS